MLTMAPDGWGHCTEIKCSRGRTYSPARGRASPLQPTREKLFDALRINASLSLHESMFATLIITMSFGEDVFQSAAALWSWVQSRTGVMILMMMMMTTLLAGCRQGSIIVWSEVQ